MFTQVKNIENPLTLSTDDDRDFVELYKGCQHFFGQKVKQQLF
jgi:hypothetical protein